MPRVVVLLVACLLYASTAWAGVWGRATWNACSSDGGGISGTFSCDDNTGSESVVFTLISDSTLSGVVAAVVTLDLYTLPACWYVIDTWGEPWPAFTSYWYLGTGGCRNGALSAANDFWNHPWAESDHCQDLWQGLGLTGPGINLLTRVEPANPYRVQWSAAFALPYGTTAEAEPGVEYYVLRLILSKARSAGPGACDGCCQDMYLCASMELDGYTYRRKAVFERPWSGLTWEGAGAACRVPAGNRTWGQIKTLYR